MDLLKLLFYIKFIFITVTFSNCYKFSCHYSYRYFNKRCYLLISVTEISYKSIFLCSIPKELKSALPQFTVVDRFRNVGPLTNTNILIKKKLSKDNLRCLSIAFDYKPRNLVGVLILQSEVAVKNFNKKLDVDNYGKRIRHDSHRTSKRNFSFNRSFNKNKRSVMRRMSCPVNCS